MANKQSTKMIKKIGLLILFFLSFVTAYAQQPLPPEQAFILTAKAINQNTILLHWEMPEGYYLYRDRFHFDVEKPKNVTLGEIVFPEGSRKYDKEIGNYEVYKNHLDLTIPINQSPKQIHLIVTYQGCSESGFCYPPVSKDISFNLSSASQPAAAITTADTAAPLPLSPQQKETTLLTQRNFLISFFGFLGFGLLLAFTPCVLPMIPILSGIILGHGHHISTRKAFVLSLIYVLSMAVTYAIAGLVVGYLGSNLQAVFQKPWIIILFSLIFILLALSLFGFYHIQPPRGLEAFLAKISHHQKKGSYIGAAVMGCLGSLIISPCVTPPLVAVLSYIGQSGDAFLGATTLFATGLGMGIPLLLIGTSWVKLIPKTGAWMNTTKSFIGVLLLASSIILLSRILPGPVTLFLWAILLIGCAIYMGSLTNGSKKSWAKLWRGLGLAMLVYGILLIIGGAMGNTDPLKPFSSSKTEVISFHLVENTQELNQALAFAKTQDKPVMLDFYADWCISCKVMDRTVFSDPKVKEALKNFILLRADITANSSDDKILLQQNNVIAPPTLLFFTKNGAEVANMRIVGEINSKQFLNNLQKLEQ